MKTDNIIKAVAAKIDLHSFSLYAYLLPSGEKRIGIKDIGLALGKAENFFFEQKVSDDTENIKKENDFSGELICVKTDNTQEIFNIIKTVSIHDFAKLISYEAIANKNIKAIMLLATFAETGLEKIINDAFNGDDYNIDKVQQSSNMKHHQPSKSLVSMIGSGQGCYDSSEAADQFLRKERDQWD